MDHPHIAPLLGAFQDRQCFVWVTEFFPGGELFHLLTLRKRFDEKEVLFWSAEILSALSYLHSIDILYRYLQLEGVMVSARGHIKLKEMGLAKQLQNGDTTTHTFCGVPEYLSPEVIEGKGYGKPADCWSFGILVYEMLVGCPPFYHHSQETLFMKIRSEALHFPRVVSDRVKPLLQKLLDRKPDTRMTCDGAKDYLTQYADIHWDHVYANETEPPPASIPQVDHEDAVSLYPIFETPRSDEMIDETWGVAIFENLLKTSTIKQTREASAPKKTHDCRYEQR